LATVFAGTVLLVFGVAIAGLLALLLFVPLMGTTCGVS
jgi:hypothetical protein